MSAIFNNILANVFALSAAAGRARAFYLILGITVLILLVVALPFLIGQRPMSGDMSAYTTEVSYEIEWFPYYNSVGE